MRSEHLPVVEDDINLMVLVMVMEEVDSFVNIHLTFVILNMVILVDIQDLGYIISYYRRIY